MHCGLGFLCAFSGKIYIVQVRSDGIWNPAIKLLYMTINYPVVHLRFTEYWPSLRMLVKYVVVNVPGQ